MQRIQRTVKTVAVMISIGVAAGCATPRAWNYIPSTPPLAAEPLLDATVAVTPFEDSRPAYNTNHLFLYWIPVLPFGWQNLATPEIFPRHVHTSYWAFDPSEDFARALAAELSRARVFRTTSFAPTARDNDLVLEGRILSTRFLGFKLSYGLSAAAPAAWALGLPSAHITNGLKIELTLKDAKTGRILWSGEYLSEIKGLNGLYYDRPDFFYPELFGDIAGSVAEDLAGLQTQLAL